MKMHIAATSVTMLLAFPALADDTSVADMIWMSGCWASTEEEPGSGEQWMAPAGRSMLGMSRTVRGGATVAVEFLRITEVEDGGIVLVTLPSGQQATTFALVSQSENEVVFENPEHDFPQRVTYRLMSEKLLAGRIEGTINGAVRTIDFPMRKTDCGSGDDV
jgi:hypothetical protein